MQLVIEISEDEYELVRHGNKSFRTELELMNAVAKGTPLPKRHGRIIDESKITSIYSHEEKAKQGAIRFNWIVIDGTDAPTIIEAADKSEV